MPTNENKYITEVHLLIKTQNKMNPLKLELLLANLLTKFEDGTVLDYDIVKLSELLQM